MEQEIWKDVEGYNGAYKVSNNGRVKRVAGEKWNGKAFHFFPEAIFEGTVAKKTGYIVVNIMQKVVYMHRLVAGAFKKEDIYYGLDVNHKDGNKQNNSSDNLEWCTRKFNINHAFDTGLIKVKSDHHSSKYSQELVDEIIQKAKDTGLKATELKKLYYPDIPRTTISSFICMHRRKGR